MSVAVFVCLLLIFPFVLCSFVQICGNLLSGKNVRCETRTESFVLTITNVLPTQSELALI